MNALENAVSRLEKRVEQLERKLQTAYTAWRELELAIYDATESRERRFYAVVAIISHTVIAVALIIAYVVVTATGSDGTLVLGILGGYLGGAVVSTTAERQRRVTP